MIIDLALAEAIAREAFTEPYRQTQPMHTRAIEKWLNERGIRLRWESIHHLWAVGVLHPIAVERNAVGLTPDLTFSSRFESIDLGKRGAKLLDLGCEVVEDEITPAPSRFPTELRESVWWHPFQLWQFETIGQILSSRLSSDAVLSGPEPFSDLMHRLASWTIVDLVSVAEDDIYHSFMALLALLLAADPLVHPLVFGSITWNGAAGETSDGYSVWQANQNSPLLPKHGIDVGTALDWHQRLSLAAQSRDQLGPFKHVVREADQKKRAGLRGETLLAQDLYDVAAILRHYLNQYHQADVPNEITYGRLGPGSSTPTLRELTRNLGIDPQEHVWWFVEGQTEEAYIHAWAQHAGIDLRRAGIEIRNVKGTGKFKPEWLLPDLEYCKRQKVFAYVSVDQDIDQQRNVSGVRTPIPNHIVELDKYDQRGLLPGGFAYWCEDFVNANFSVEELASIAVNLAHEAGHEIAITVDEILQERDFEDGVERKPRLKVERALRNLLEKKTDIIFDKGMAWGQALGKWASEHPVLEAGKTEMLAFNDDQRPVTKILVMLLNARNADYDVSVEEHARNRKDIRSRPCNDMGSSPGRRSYRGE